MENQPVPSKKIMLNYGLYLGIVSIIISVAVYALGMHYEQDWKNMVIGIIVMFVIIFLGIKKYKEFNSGYLTIGQALKTGIGIALIGGIIGVIYSYIFMNFIEPDFMDKMMELQQQKMIEDYPQLSDEQIETQIELMNKFSTPLISSAFQIIGSLFFGFVISLIVGFIQKNDPKK